MEARVMESPHVQHHALVRFEFEWSGEASKRFELAEEPGSCGSMPATTLRLEQ